MYIFFIVIFILIVLIILFYNRLVAANNRVLSAWSDIDVQLKRRQDLIPNLVDVVKQYASYEQSVLTKLVELRQQSQIVTSMTERSKVETALGKSVGDAMILVEAYPDLKANENFLQLQKDMTEVEDNIQYARRYYNGAVKVLNIAIESFPSNLVANLFGFKIAEYFTMEEKS